MSPQRPLLILSILVALAVFLFQQSPDILSSSLRAELEPWTSQLSVALSAGIRTLLGALAVTEIYIGLGALYTVARGMIAATDESLGVAWRSFADFNAAVVVLLVIYYVTPGEPVVALDKPLEQNFETAGIFLLKGAALTGMALLPGMRGRRRRGAAAKARAKK
ncbi:hypothetical protein R3P38DRAFT_3360004 [Favolaschia claudopus]|uniref:Uncharacterized protein n=1 Tax=Favolaschia claudopus TaxID=2862362 RepID=A0AAW0AWW3_9AGAR